MRRAWFFVLPLLVHCSGQHVVAGKEKTGSERLEESSATWCGQTCDRIIGCSDAVPCDCAELLYCRCIENDRDECLEQCQEALATYVGHGEPCASIGRHYQSCVDDLSCDDFSGQSGKDCEPSSAERSACPRDGDPDSPSDPMGDGMTATAGSASAPGGTAGNASSSGGTSGVSGSVPVGGTAPVPRERITCLGVSGKDGASGGRAGVDGCEQSRTQCPDGAQYYWTCGWDTEDRLICSCVINGATFHHFDPMSDACPTIEQVNAECGFALDQ